MSDDQVLLAALRDLGERLDAPASDPAGYGDRAGPDPASTPDPGTDGNSPATAAVAPDPVAAAIARIRRGVPGAPAADDGRTGSSQREDASGRSARRAGASGRAGTAAGPHPPGRAPSGRAGTRRRVRTQGRQVRPRSPRLVPALAVAAALVVAVVVAVPGPRGAVGRLLGVGGARVELGDGLPAGVAGLDGLGERITIDEARRRVPGPMEPDGVGTPSAGFAGWPDGGVSLVWPAQDGLPPLDRAQPDGPALIVTAFPTRSGGYDKVTTRDTDVEAVEVDGSPGYWISGPHDVDAAAPGDPPASAALRLAGDALVWEDGALTYRLESDLDRDAAIALAETIG